MYSIRVAHRKRVVRARKTVVRSRALSEYSRLLGCLAGGGSESQCGWLKDKFGVSWKIVPVQLSQLLAKNDAATSGRMMAALMTMKKLDIAAMGKAYHGTWRYLATAPTPRHRLPSIASSTRMRASPLAAAVATDGSVIAARAPVCPLKPMRSVLNCAAHS